MRQLENNTDYGAFPYKLGGFTYNLRDLVTLPYFGAPISWSVNGWLSFQDSALSICFNGSLKIGSANYPLFGAGSFVVGN